MEILMIVSGATCFLVVVVYLLAMGRIAILMQRAGIAEIGLADPNGQIRLIKAVFWKKGMDARFHDSHTRLVTTARISGVIGLVLVVSISFAILMGYLH
ncbi:hypothetical protein [Luteibacter sp. Lutesp34]|uniref:hypothetical protein n=1 Tax=Luteibacter sp. Lutesp34 TaxID=3243030 RepID=UPI0039B3F9B9